MQSLRDRLLAAEIACETLLAGIGESSGASATARGALASACRALCEVVHGDARLAPQAWCAQVAATAGALDADWRWRWEHAGEVLGAQPPWSAALPRLRDTTVPATPPQEPRPPPQQGRRRWLADEPTRHALQAGAAALVAVLAGHAISAEHWYWAVFGAFVIFTNASTRGQAAAGAWRRVLGNVAGLALGLLLAELAQGDWPLQLALLFVFIFAGFYAFQGLQAIYIALLTAMLAMLYELLGKYSPGLLVLRLGETLTGAAAAVLSAILILPSRTGEQSDQETVALLREAARLLRSAFEGSLRGSPTDAVRDLDRRLQALRQALGPVTGRELPAYASRHRTRLQQMAALVHCVRHCCNLLALKEGGWREREDLRARADAVAENIGRVAHALARPGLVPALRELPAVAAGPEDAPDPARIAAHWLEEADAVLRQIHQGPPTRCSPA
nr:FUSC family protein [Ramlibacter ginsenosidimutans]